MVDTKWTIHGREFVNCNCSYGCPCQFDGPPTHGHCLAVAGMQIEKGYHGSTHLDGLKFVGIFRWPGPIHEGAAAPHALEFLPLCGRGVRRRFQRAVVS